MKVRKLILFILVFNFTHQIQLSAQTNQENAIWNRDKATGLWGGLRTGLSESGIEIEANLIGDIMSNISGGMEQKTALIQLSTLKILLDPEEMFGIQGMNLLASGIQSNGESISALTGDVQGVSNVEAEQTVRLYELWIQQNFLAERISVLGGLYDINSEFDYMESASLFVQSSHGLGGEFAGSGLIGPPTYPIGGLGARLKLLPSPKFYLKFGVFDGVSGKLNSLEHADFSWKREDGSLFISEIGFLTLDNSISQQGNELTTLQNRRHIGREVSSDYKFKLALGAWSYSKNYLDERFGSDIERPFSDQNDKGFYLLADLKITPNLNKPYQQLSLFARIGYADCEVSRFGAYRGGGITYKGLMSGDPNGLLGVSVASVRNSRVYSDLFPENKKNETVFELTYLTKIIPWLNLQPNVQYIINPGTSDELNNALVIGLRTDITL
jgi:porin